MLETLSEPFRIRLLEVFHIRKVVRTDYPHALPHAKMTRRSIHNNDYNKINAKSSA